MAPTTIQPLYTATATSKGGRNGHVRSDDGTLDLGLTMPKALGGAQTAGTTNPEQLFAAGYSACFLSALKLVAGKSKVALPADTSITGTVGIGPNASGGFALKVQLEISAPGLAKEQVSELVEKAHQVCPYSNATRGNVEVDLVVV